MVCRLHTVPDRSVGKLPHHGISNLVQIKVHRSSIRLFESEEEREGKQEGERKKSHFPLISFCTLPSPPPYEGLILGL